jgi:hypothetical protein
MERQERWWLSRCFEDRHNDVGALRRDMADVLVTEEWTPQVLIGELVRAPDAQQIVGKLMGGHHTDASDTHERYS